MVVPVSHLPVMMLPGWKQRSGAGAGSHHGVLRPHQRFCSRYRSSTSPPRWPSSVHRGSRDTFVTSWSWSPDPSVRLLGWAFCGVLGCQFQLRSFIWTLCARLQQSFQSLLSSCHWSMGTFAVSHLLGTTFPEQQRINVDIVCEQGHRFTAVLWKEFRNRMWIHCQCVTRVPSTIQWLIWRTRGKPWALCPGPAPQRWYLDSCMDIFPFQFSALSGGNVLFVSRVCSESFPSFLYPCDLLMLTNSASVQSSHAPAREVFKETLTLENMWLCIVMSAAACADSASTGWRCCFSAALQSPALPFAHNFRLVSLATRVSAHEEQPTSPDESFCKYSHDHWGREREEERENICPNKWPNLPKLVPESLMK